MSASLETKLFGVASSFCDIVNDWERRLRPLASPFPPPEAVDAVVSAFWEMFHVADELEGENHDNGDLRHIKERFRSSIVWVVGRSRYHWRTMFRPHGFSGDHITIEWMYELEENGPFDPGQPAIVNCLDACYTSIPSFHAVCERRRHLCAIAVDEYASRGSLRVLDIACGGARYLSDFLTHPSVRADCTALHLVDQDPSAARILGTRFAGWRNVQHHCLPLRKILSLADRGPFDLIIISGLLDYLSHDQASSLIAFAHQALADGGAVAVTNFHPADRSAIVLDWGADWQIIHRDESDLASVFPSSMTVETTLSDNGSLVYALGRALR
jgi:SAM-dependent methyltransferase